MIKMASDTEKLRNIAKIPGMKELVGSLGIKVIEDIAEKTAQLQTENKRLEGEKKVFREKYWSDLNTARCILQSRIDDLTALAKDIRQNELALKRKIADQALQEKP